MSRCETIMRKCPSFLNKGLACFLILLLLSPTYAEGQESKVDAAVDKQGSVPESTETPGKIVKVTLFRDQALVTRQIDIAAADGEREIAIGRLPEQVVADSLFAEGDESIQVRGVRVSPTASTASDREDVRELMAAIEEVNRKSSELDQQIGALEKQSKYIDNLMNFSAASSKSDLSRGVLDAEALTQVTEYGMEKQLALEGERFELAQKSQSVEREKEQLVKRLELLTRSEQTVYEATVIVANPNGDAGSVLLSYLVAGCSWTPQYTIRGELGSEQFGLRYSASVEQMSGEDWQDVQLTLSTASPSISAAGPVLTPFRVATANASVRPSANAFGGGYGGYGGYGGGGMGGGGMGGGGMGGGMAAPFGDGSQASQSAGSSLQSLQAKSKELLRKKSEVASFYSNAQSDDDNLSRDLALNDVANEFQSLELQADSKQLKTLASDAADEVSSQSYPITETVSLSSRREKHSVLIVEDQLAGELYHVATPLLSSFAYREANMINDRTEGLLGGPATVYLDGRFVGRTELPSIAAGQHLIVGFGADQQVRTRRELLDKSEDIQGGNRKQTLRYRLVVANFKKEPVALRVMDRMPMVTQGSDVSLSYDPASPPLSEDGLYRRVQYPRGILRWDVEVPGEQFGEKAFDLEYAYTTEFDRTKRLEVAAYVDSAQMQQDLFEAGAPSSGVGGMGGGMGGFPGSGPGQ